MRILFSPVGGSDPIKRMLDGPMLHCCRVYKPDIVCLYFTQSMLEYENRDQRYTCLLYTSPSPRDGLLSRMPSSA